MKPIEPGAVCVVMPVPGMCSCADSIVGMEATVLRQDLNDGDVSWAPFWCLSENLQPPCHGDNSMWSWPERYLLRIDGYEETEEESSRIPSEEDVTT